jgi:peptide/nickel transport system substrate-binding protein
MFEGASLTCWSRFRHGRSLPLTALILVAGLLGASCSGSGSGSESRGDPKVLVSQWGGEPETLDPARAEAGNYGDNVIIQVYEFLVDIGPDGPEPIPMLATDVPTQENGLVSEDGLTYTFPIREGVVFHDGSELTAEDVKYSWDRVVEMDMPEGQADTLTQIISETRVVDEFTFEATLKAPAAWFLSSVVNSTPAAIVSSEAVEENGGITPGEPNEFMETNMVGTGPHRLVSWERNEQLEFEVFEDYWGEPAALPVRIEVVTESSAVLLGLRAGDFDLIEPQPQYVETLRSDDNVCIDESDFLLEPLHLAFNLNIPVDRLPGEDTIPGDFFHDVRVRQAFNYAFDYGAYMQALAGLAEKATYLPPGLLGYDPNGPKYSQDLARAEELFRETGWWDGGFSLSVLVESGSPTFVAIGLVLKDSLERLNEKFQIHVRQVAEAQFDQAHGKTPFEYAAWIKNADPFRDPHFLMETYYHPDGEWGERLGFRNGYENPDEIASLIDRAGASTDLDEREQLYGQVTQLVHDDPMWIWVADERNVQIYRCEVEGFVFNPVWTFVRWRYYDKAA